MIKLYHASMSRSVRVVWLLEELGLPYELEKLPLVPPLPTPFRQETPFGKLPVLEDEGMVMFESGAIVEYILERYAEGRLAPRPDSPARGPFLQWIHFSETAFAGLGNLAWHTRFKGDAEHIPEAMADYRGWSNAAMDLLERELGGKDFILGDAFTAADIMLGYTVFVAKAFGVLSESTPNLNGYFERLKARPALQKAFQA